MNKITHILVSILVALIASPLSAFTKVATDAPILVQVGKHKHWCPVCGMDLKMYYKTSHTLEEKNSTPKQYCSLRCLAVDLQEHKNHGVEIKVVDALSEKLIDARTAFYVVGSDVKGTMSKVSKLAFSTAESADDFNMEHGGEVVDFNTALKIAQDSLESDIDMVNKKKEKKIYPMGKKIFEKICNQDIQLNKFHEINRLKAAIKNEQLCKEMKEQELQALSLYLWEVKRFDALEKSGAIIKVTKDEKCPICGMFVYKYPKWAAQIFYKDMHYSFDGVKDMMKYYYQHKEDISKILVTDYYSQEAIDAFKAYFVVGSDVYGPMGDELIPFKNESEAKTFRMDHKGYKIFKFSDIKEEEVYKLD